ncbi:MAG: TonB-dependent receptor [Gemmatimonadales bacterium]|nr:MAG: TonB-dependent receptor [Gemmatimonadales bacterium]
MGWTPGDAHEVRLGGDVTRQTYDNEFGQLGQINMGAEPGSAAFPDRLRGYDQELGFNREQLHLAHRWDLGRGLWDSSVALNTTETTGRTIPSGAATEESGRRGTPRTLESRTVTVDTRFVALLGDHTLSVGGQYLDAQMTDGIPNRTFESDQIGLFAENEWRATDRLALTGGARLDYHSTFGSQVSPRAYAVWEASETWALKGGVARGYRTPSLEQLEDGIIGFGNNGRDPLFGNPDLKPELSTNWEAGVDVRPGARLSGSVVAFRTELTDRIERPVAATGGETANVGEALLQGVESSVRGELAEGWTFRADHTFIHSEVTTGAAAGLVEGDPLFGVPAHMLNARLSWQVTPAVEARLGGQYRSSRHRPDSFHEPHLGGSAQGATEVLGDFEAYTLLDLGASWRMNERLTVNATVENLLDRSFVDYRPYPLRNSPETTAFSNVYNNILEPRRLALTLRAAF